MRIGVDLGGTKIEAIALDATGAVLSRIRVPTPVGDYKPTLAAVAELVARIERETGAAASIGIGTPGAISARTGLIKNSNSVVLNGKPLDVDLSDRLKRPVRLENDANCFALSEATDGAGAGAPTVFGVIIGTGVGGGLVVDGRILGGANHIAGEWGHNPLPWADAHERNGHPCYCGRSGCIETFLSGGALSRDHAAATGSHAGALEIAELARCGDVAATLTLDRYRDRLARALASVLNVLDPHVVVLGGGVSNIASLYEGLAAQVAGYAFSDAIATPIVRNRHGDSSGVRGAAWLGAG